MTEGSAGAIRPSWSWLKLFSTFQIALDPKKLLLAAAGLLAMWLGTFILSAFFFAMKSEPLQASYDVNRYQKADPNLTVEQARLRAETDYQRDLDHYLWVRGFAGPDGSLRVLPWNENRGPNPLKLARHATEEGGISRIWGWFKHHGSRILVEPLVKFIKPIALMLGPKADFGTRIFLLLVAFVVLAVWAFFGGAITRIAVLQLAGKDPPSLAESLRFVCGKYVHYIAAPMVPVLFVAGIVVIALLFSLVHLIPIIGDLWDGVFWPIYLLLGFAQALLLVGLAGYPLMFPTISAEGSDTFDALSRSYNYVYQSPWHYIWNAILAVAYGMVLVFFVVFMGSMVLYLTKWSLNQNPATEYISSRRIDHLFIYAPSTFELNDLLVDQTKLKPTSSPEDRAAYISENVWGMNKFSAVLVKIWTIVVVLFMIGFGYSYFFTASSMIYLLMRQSVDDTEIDEVYTDDAFADEPMLPPMPPPAPTGPPVQMVDSPTLRTPPVEGGTDKPASGV